MPTDVVKGTIAIIFDDYINNRGHNYLYKTQQQMLKTGGSFIRKLAELMKVADVHNLRTILRVWAPEITEYFKFAMYNEQNENEEVDNG